MVVTKVRWFCPETKFIRSSLEILTCDPTMYFGFTFFRFSYRFLPIFYIFSQLQTLDLSAMVQGPCYNFLQKYTILYYINKKLLIIKTFSSTNDVYIFARHNIKRCCQILVHLLSMVGFCTIPVANSRPTYCSNIIKSRYNQIKYTIINILMYNQ